VPRDSLQHLPRQSDDHKVATIRGPAGKTKIDASSPQRRR
jgi:hypothetical protein